MFFWFLFSIFFKAHLKGPGRPSANAQQAIVPTITMRFLAIEKTRSKTNMGVFCALTAWFVVFVAMRLQLHPFLRNIVVSGLSAFLAGAFHHVFPDAKMDLIIIGTFMLQVPGVLMTNGVRDILSGDYIAGFLSLMEAGMVAIAMAIGAAFGLSLVGYL